MHDAWALQYDLHMKNIHEHDQFISWDPLEDFPPEDQPDFAAMHAAVKQKHLENPKSKLCSMLVAELGERNLQIVQIADLLKIPGRAAAALVHGKIDFSLDDLVDFAKKIGWHVKIDVVHIQQ